MPICRLTDTDTGTAMLPAYHAALTAAYEHDVPGPVTPYSMFAFTALHGWAGDAAEAYVHLREGAAGAVTGGYILELPLRDNTHVALVRHLAVAPEHRRSGIGSELLAHAISRARAHGRRVLIGEAPAHGPGAAFARARGFTPVTTDDRMVLDLSAVTTEGLERLRDDALRHAEGYTLERWAGLAPERYIPDMTALMNGMNDAPRGDLDMEDERWDDERAVKSERSLVQAGLTGYQTLARHAATGEPAGYTRILVPSKQPDGWALQVDTVVLRPHRGHRLGMALKAANLLWLREREPGVKRIVTWNADSNSHMIEINERLGFRPLDRWHEWQLHLDR